MSEHKRDVIVIGASAGGVEALVALVKALPADLPAAIAIVLHIAPDAPGRLHLILSHAGHLPAMQATDGLDFEQGHIYIAPPDRHLLLGEGHLHLVRGSKENRQRPAVDVLFRSAALAYGPRVIGIILTGALDDGTAGLLAIKRRGGIAVVQDPNEALYDGMPRSAIEHVQVDHSLSLTEMPALLARLTAEPAPDEKSFPVPEEMQREVRIAAMGLHALNHQETVGTPSIYSCPECGGVLWEIRDGTLTRYRCRTGHAFSVAALLEEQKKALETALWAALKTLEERNSILRQLADQAKQQGHYALAESFLSLIKELEEHTALICRVLFAGEE